MSEKIVQLNEKIIKGQLKELVRKVSQALLCSSLHDGIGRYLIVENHRFPVIRITL